MNVRGEDFSEGWRYKHRWESPQQVVYYRVWEEAGVLDLEEKRKKDEVPQWISPLSSLLWDAASLGKPVGLGGWDEEISLVKKVGGRDLCVAMEMGTKRQRRTHINRVCWRWDWDIKFRGQEREGKLCTLPPCSTGLSSLLCKTNYHLNIFIPIHTYE